MRATLYGHTVGSRPSIAVSVQHYLVYSYSMNPDTDPLSELLVDSAEVDRQAIANALRGVVGVGPKTKAVVTQHGFDALNSRQQVVALLLGAKVAHLLDVLDSDGLATREVVASSGLAGGTARPTLRYLLEKRFISQDSEARYYIAHHQVPAAIEQLSRPSEKGDPTPRPSKRITKRRKVDDKAPQKKSKSTGLAAAIASLVDSGFFESPRTLRDVQERLRKKKGLTVDLPKLSPIMLRLLRTEVLDRDENADGVYEYVARN